MSRKTILQLSLAAIFAALLSTSWLAAPATAEPSAYCSVVPAKLQPLSGSASSRTFFE